LLATDVMKDYNLRSKQVHSNQLLSLHDSSLVLLLLVVCGL